MADIYNIIAAINPDEYYDGGKSDISKFKGVIKSKGIIEAAEKAKAKPLRNWKLIYNSPFETLEPVYFWILDFMGYPDKVEKIVDNFASSPGSGHFSELMGKATRMQEEAMKVMQTIGVLVKSIVNIIYDLRQFEIVLNDYKAATSDNKTTAEAGLIALKQRWLDNVDIKRGNTSIKGMTFSQASFATLLDAFFFIKSLKSLQDNKPDLNERVIRILEQRLLEFEKWRELSEKEMQKRYNIERAYLKSQVDSLKLYSRWAKPYLKAAAELRMNDKANPSLVTAFNTINMNVTLMKKDAIKVEEEVYKKNLPKSFFNNKDARKYYACSIVDFNFRGIPQKSDQHYTFGGRVDVSFKAYALNQDELDLFTYGLEKSDLKEAMDLAKGATEDSLKEIQDDIDYFLKSDDEKKKDKSKESDEENENNDTNPFTALLGIDKLKIFEKKSGKKKSSEEEKKERAEKLSKEGIKPDTYAESMLRKLAEANAIDSCYSIYNTYKKGHGMATTREPV
jgi:hypothetical protein